jgi:hypothetical protein
VLAECKDLLLQDRTDSDDLTIPLDLDFCVIQFKHHSLTTEEVASCLKLLFHSWNLSSFSDQMADKVFQLVTDTENYNISLSSNSKVFQIK